MEVVFYTLTDKDMGRQGPGRRYYCLVATRRIALDTHNRSLAYDWACANALLDESAVSVDGQPVSPLVGIPGDSPVFECLRRAHAGKAGYIIHTLGKAQTPIRPQIQKFHLGNEIIPLTKLKPVALPTGAVVSYGGVLYVVSGEDLIPMEA